MTQNTYFERLENLFISYIESMRIEEEQKIKARIFEFIENHPRPSELEPNDAD